MNSIDNKIILTYKTIFPDKTPKAISEYLKGGNKAFILKAAIKFATIEYNKHPSNNFINVIKLFFGPYNENYAIELLNRSKKNAISSNTIFFNIWSSLKLFETYFEIGESTVTQSDAEFERNIFEAYLALNLIFTEKQYIGIISTEETQKHLKLPARYFSMHYIIADKIDVSLHKTWLTQTIKSIYLFQYISTNESYSNLLQAILNRFESINWKEYLKEIIHLTGLAKNGNPDIHTDIIPEKNERHLQGCKFLEHLSIQKSDEIHEFDFLTLRMKPFYEIEQCVFRVIYKPFAVEKIYTGQYFIFKDIKAKEPGITNFDIRSDLNYNFSEGVLLYKTIRSIYPNKGIHFSGKEMQLMKMESEPDYYLRLGNRILLFESKDFLIQAKIKESCDFRLIEPELKKRLYYGHKNGKQYNGAILQLINNIRILLTKDFKADQNYNYRDVLIYPILIIHHPQYDIGGFNYMVNSWLQEQLNLLEDEGYFVKRVKPITIINIDDLLFFENGLRDNINLHTMIDLYLKYVNILPGIKFKEAIAAENYLLKQLVTFSTFIKSEFRKRDLYSTPKAIEDLKIELFSNEND